jgi:hypothetical protein
LRQNAQQWADGLDAKISVRIVYSEGASVARGKRLALHRNYSSKETLCAMLRDIAMAFNAQQPDEPIKIQVDADTIHVLLRAEPNIQGAVDCSY